MTTIQSKKKLKNIPLEKDIEYSKWALELAAKGIGLVSPNPLVGCVVVSPDGEVVGEAVGIGGPEVRAGQFEALSPEAI